MADDEKLRQVIALAIQGGTPHFDQRVRSRAYNVATVALNALHEAGDGYVMIGNRTAIKKVWCPDCDELHPASDDGRGHRRGSRAKWKIAYVKKDG